MATLKKHGQHVIIEYLWVQKAVCEDGTILKNYGGGWHVHGKLKDKAQWASIADKWAKQRDESFAMSPEAAKLLEKIKSMKLSWIHRKMLRGMLEDSSHDPYALFADIRNNVWGYDAPRIGIDDLLVLCALYQALKHQRAIG